jgi:23S rRNA pseudouridine1911/1915/1917 synthase
MSEDTNLSLAYRVPPGHGGQRLDRFLAAAATNLSRTRVKSLIETGHVSIDGATATDPSHLIRAGQTAVLLLPPPDDPAPLGEHIPLDIVFEDEHLIVIDKPAGLVVHPAAGHESGTLVNALIAHCGASLSGIGGVRRPGIVHRLDKDTSGLLVVAKTDAAHHGLARIFADHGMTLPLSRAYLAFVWGTPARPSGTIDAPLARHAASRQKIAVMPAWRGRRAVTHWRLIESFAGETSLISCKLETGRTHQIRVHMAHLGHPVLGDPVYATGFKSKTARLLPNAQACLVSLSRQALHAAELGFPHPVTGVQMRFESMLPPDLRRLRDALASGEAARPGQEI